MFHKPVSGLAGIALLSLCASFAAAQDFHVETQIFDLQPPAAAKAKGAPKKDSRPQLVGSCESLFHAGKVYDHNRNISQMTIYEPAQQRFVIIDDSRNLATRISFGEITNQLIQDRASVDAVLGDPERHKMSAERVAFLRFQLQPDFREELGSGGPSPSLLMTSPLMQYRVECATESKPELVKAYLEYADWAYRLSFVSRRTAILPEARLAVNDALRRENLLPVKVTLNTRDPNGIHVRAEHKFGWELNRYNKSTISHWEAKAVSKSTKYVSWEKFLETTLETAQRR